MNDYYIIGIALVFAVLLALSGVITGMYIYRRAWRDRFFQEKEYYPPTEHTPIIRKSKPKTTEKETEYNEDFDYA